MIFSFRANVLVKMLAGPKSWTKPHVWTRPKYLVDRNFPPAAFDLVAKLKPVRWRTELEIVLVRSSEQARSSASESMAASGNQMHREQNWWPPKSEFGSDGRITGSKSHESTILKTRVWPRKRPTWVWRG